MKKKAIFLATIIVLTIVAGALAWGNGPMTWN